MELRIRTDFTFYLGEGVPYPRMKEELFSMKEELIFSGGKRKKKKKRK